MKSSYTAILLLSAWFGHWRPTSLGTEKKSSKSPRSIFFGGRRTAVGRFHGIWPIRPPPDDALLGGSALPAYKEGRGGDCHLIDRRSAAPFMPLFAIPFPAVDPIAISLGPFAIRWYALAYIVGLLIGWRYCLALRGRPPHIVTRQAVDDFLVWATLGVVLGGRIGYVLFY